MAELKITKTRALPLDAVTQTLAFIARKGAGKTYAAGKLVEELLGAGAPVVVLDPVGNVRPAPGCRWQAARPPDPGAGRPAR